MTLSRAARPRRVRSWLNFEVLEDRLAPTANLLVSSDGKYPQQAVREYTPSGSLVQSVAIPPGAIQQDALDLAVGADGRVHVFNGSTAAFLSSYDPATGTWAHRSYGGWNATSNSGLGVYQDFVFATDNQSTGDASIEKGIVRFDLTDGTATRFATDFNPQDLNVGRDGLVYALDSFRTVRVYNPQTLALVRTLSLPSTVGGSSQFYTGIAANANGDVYTSTSSNRSVHRFDSAGTWLATGTVSTSVGWLYDVEVSPDGTQVAAGSSSGNVALMSSALTGVTSFATGTSGTTYVSFGLDPAAPPWLNVNDVSVTEGNAGTATASFTVSLSAASSQTVTVNWATANGTATGSDYTAASGTLTFAPGETTKTVDVVVLGDTLTEGNETFTVTLSGASGAPVGDGQGIGTILDDEGLPSISISDVYVNEGGSAAKFIVTLSAASSQTVTVNWTTANGTGAAGSDYTSASGTVTFTPGEMSQSVGVLLLGDALDEYNETFFVNLSGPTNATILDGQGVATISDDDDALASVGDVTVTEGDAGTVNAVFTITVSAAHDHTVSVTWSTADNTAVSSTDYNFASGTFGLLPGEMSKTVTVTIKGDTVAEHPETFFVNLTGASSGFGDWQGVGTILDNDPPALTVNDVTVTEGNSGTVNATFTVSLSVPPTQTVTVDWATASGTATPGTDYTAASGTLTFEPGETTKTVMVAVLGDPTDEANETFFVNLSNQSGATMADAQGVGTISDDDPAPQVAINNVSVSESAGTAVFTVTLSAASSLTVTANYATQAWTATAGSDYTHVSGTLTFAPGETTKTITVPIVNDTVQESNEEFSVNLSGLVNATSGDSQGSGTIVNDDFPLLTVNDITVTEGDFGTTTATFTVSLSYAISGSIRVDWATANGTATADPFAPYILGDYAPASSWFLFMSGQTSKTISVTVRGDQTFEPNETFFVNLTAEPGVIIADGQGMATIADDDPYVLSVSDAVVSEAAGEAVFTVTLSQPSSQTITTNYATSQFQALAGVDYTDVSGTLTFAPGETVKTVAVPLIDDGTYEPEEQFYFDLSGTVNAKPGLLRRYGRIQNDDAYPTLSINDVSVVEGDTGVTYAAFTVSLSNPTYQTVDLFWVTDNGTAGWAFDYAYSGGSLSFSPGQTSKTVSIAVYGDLELEPDETFFVILNAGGSNAGVTDGLGQATIVNDDTPAASVGDVTVTEGTGDTTTATFTVTLSKVPSQTTTVDWATADGTAFTDSDYTAASGTLTFAPGETSKTVTVPILGDATDEPNETFTVNLSNPVGATIADGEGVGTITDDDAAPNLAITDVSLSESAGEAVFMVTLSAASAWTVTVNYATQNETAVAGSDYTAASGTLTFAPGETSKSVAVSVLDDMDSESDEDFLVNLSGAANAGYADAQGRGTIADNDPPLVSVGDVTVTEGTGGTADATFTVTLSKPWTTTVTIDWSTADGTAVAGSDYAAASGTITFAPGETSKTFTVAVLGDTTDEPNETFTVNLSNPSGATVTDGQAIGTITDDDAAANLSITDVTLAESAGLAVFTVSLSAASGWTVTVNYATQDFTADAGIDYTATSGTLTFAPGETTKTVAVSVLDDADQENDESFIVNLSGAVHAGYADSQGWATIVDDDPPLVSIDDVSVTEGDAGGVTATFTVSLSKPGNSSVWVDWATAHGTATGLDYNSASGTLVFSPGQTSKTISVTVLGELRTEADETFLVNLTVDIGGAIADGQGVGTILDDDPHVLTVDSPSAVESTGAMVYTVTLSQASAQTVTVNYATEDYIAAAGSDYTATSGTLTFAPGETVKTISVPVTDDNRREAESEVFYLRLSAPVNAKLGNTIGNGQIVDDDPVPSVTIHDVGVVEGDSGTTAAVFSVTLSNPTDWEVDLFWVTANGTASYLWDYAYSGGSVSFAPGQTTATLNVSVYGELTNEPDETFLVNISAASNYATIDDGQGVGTILTDDFPPVADAGPDQTAAEGAAVAFNGGGSSDPDGDALTYHWDFGDGGTADVAAPTHTYADNGTYTVTLTVSDGHGGSSTDTLTVTVSNVVPTAAVAGATGGVRGQARTFTFSATDPGAADAAAPFTYAITWGDGNTQTVTGPAGGVQVEHVYAATGSYTVSATATDKDGGTSGAATQAVTIVAAQLQGGDLVVGGTTGADTITFSRVSSTSVRAVVNGVNLGTFTTSGTVLAYGQAANDTIQVTGSNFPRRVMFFGGDGNDMLDGRQAPQGGVLVGDDGNDTLLSGSGRDILIGGLGVDSLRGGSGDDILIGGITDHDANPIALIALATEWRRTDSNLDTRIAHLNGSQTGGLNGTYLLNATTVDDDGAVDELFGESGGDWFIYVGSGATADHLNDWSGSDRGLVL